MKCQMVKTTGRLCERPARYLFLRTTSDSNIVAGYCRQHYASDSARCRIFRPAPWEYTHVIDQSTGDIVAWANRREVQA